MENYFEFINSVKICAGKNALENIPFELEFLGCSKPLILSDLGVSKAGVLDIVIKILNDNNVNCNNIFKDIPADSDISVINKIASIYKAQNCDGLIACGGGSVIDTAKGVKMVLSQNSEDILALSGNEVIKKGKHIPFIVLPTTCGTGSECTSVAVIKNHETGVKMEFISSELLPDVAFVDVRLTQTLPPKLIASSAMDALCHCIEAYSGIQKNYISRDEIEKALEVCEKVYEEEMKPYQREYGLDVTYLNKKEKAELVNKRNCLITQMETYKQLLGGNKQ